MNINRIICIEDELLNLKIKNLNEEILNYD